MRIQRALVDPASTAAMTGGAVPPDDGFFNVTTTFVGAACGVDLTASWIAYPQAATP